MSAVGGSELASVVKSQDTDSGVEKAEQRPGGTTPSPPCSLDEMFSDRYTTNNHSFARISEGFDPVICLYPFHSKPKHFEKNRPHHGSGGGWGSNEPGNDWKHYNQACLTSSPFTCVLPLATHSYAYCPQSLPFSAVPTVYHSQASQALVDPSESDFETIALKSLGGFLLIVNDNGEIYYASENIENFLGFHQSDVLHQSLYDLIHSEDRDDVRQQLNLAYSLPPGSNNPHDLYERVNDYEMTMHTVYRLTDAGCLHR